MTQSLAQLPTAAAGQFSREQVDLIKQTVAQGTSDLELQLFLEVCKSSGLNPFQRQVYAIMRQESYKDENDQWKKRSRMTIQTGIDGYRLIAARTGQHIGSSEPEYGPEEKGNPTWARVKVKRATSSGHIAEFAATCRWREYAQTNQKGEPTAMWAKMPYLMLGKVAESLALRKAFPAELSGVYTAEEMAQADDVTTVEATPTPANPDSRQLNQKQRDQLTERLEGLGLKDIPGFIVWALDRPDATLETITLGDAFVITQEAKAQKNVALKEVETTEAEFAPAV